MLWLMYVKKSSRYAPPKLPRIILENVVLHRVSGLFRIYQFENQLYELYELFLFEPCQQVFHM